MPQTAIPTAMTTQQSLAITSSTPDIAESATAIAKPRALAIGSGLVDRAVGGVGRQGPRCQRGS